MFCLVPTASRRCAPSGGAGPDSLLLAARGALLLALARDHLAQHDHAVAIHERDTPSQFLKVSHTRGCWGWKEHWAISFDFNECGSSIFLPPVSLPIFHLSLEMRQAERPQRTN